MSYSIVFAASPSAAHPKMVYMCYHKAHYLSSHYAFAEDGNLKCPHPPIIDGDIWVDWWLVVGWIWVGAALIKYYASLKKYDKMFHVFFLKIGVDYMLHE